jgi:hypothetical protein
MIIRIIKISIVIVLLYAAFMVTVPWIKFYVFRSAVVEIISNHDKISRETLVNSIYEQAGDLNIRLPENAVSIEIFKNYKRYEVEYFDNITFPLMEKGLIFHHKISKSQPVKEN